MSDTVDEFAQRVAGAARPIVDRAVDEAALIAFETAINMAEITRDETATLPGGIIAPDAAYLAGWDDAITQLVLRLRASRNAFYKLVAAHGGRLS
jgi:hypothetical protein